MMISRRMVEWIILNWILEGDVVLIRLDYLAQDWNQSWAFVYIV